MVFCNQYPALKFLFTSSDTLAHHSRAEFTGDVIVLTGELIDFSWRNPQLSFKIRMGDGPGRAKQGLS